MARMDGVEDDPSAGEPNIGFERITYLESRIAHLEARLGSPRMSNGRCFRQDPLASGNNANMISGEEKPTSNLQSSRLNSTNSRTYMTKAPKSSERKHKLYYDSHAKCEMPSSSRFMSTKILLE
jgi:hypothetical protein